MNYGRHPICIETASLNYCGVGSGITFATVVGPLIEVLVLLALYFQRRFDWGSETSGSIDTAVAEPTTDDDWPHVYHIRFRPIRIAFMCAQNAGRSQMSTAFADREREQRGLTDHVKILTGGTTPPTTSTRKWSR